MIHTLIALAVLATLVDLLLRAEHGMSVWDAIAAPGRGLRWARAGRRWRRDRELDHDPDVRWVEGLLAELARPYRSGELAGARRRRPA